MNEPTQWFYLLLHEDGSIEVEREEKAEWLEAIESGILEVFRMSSHPWRLDHIGVWAPFRG